MNFANIKYYDIANGPGVRTSLFVSGCTHRCPGCFNEIAWNFHYGEPFTEEVEKKLLDSLKSDYIKGITLLGGEPMEPENQTALLPFIRKCKETLPGKTIWCYSGYTYEELTGMEKSRCRCEVTDELLSCIDVLVDGRFVQELHDISLRFCGSSNQRIIDLPKSLSAGQIVLWEDVPIFASHSL